MELVYSMAPESLKNCDTVGYWDMIAGETKDTPIHKHARAHACQLLEMNTALLPLIVQGRPNYC